MLADSKITGPKDPKMIIFWGKAFLEVEKSEAAIWCSCNLVIINGYFKRKQDEVRDPIPATSRPIKRHEVGESVRKMDTAQRASASRLEYEDSETESFSNAYYSSDEYLDLIIDWNWTLSTKKLDTMSTLSGQTTSMVRL
ncbi:hypothetical protein M747DRAFT_308904 [Aspergillus niger ATCC 13496]|uniref:Uncharacterized protein n=1 Tax=Aspergillus niger ATCC 13496 TaxID=1353008 RepID=A0A370BM05_ASPNG|nr:hypothetical protein M747DRAFT_308904 [Aspergillus niger ATCC 13496]